MAKTPHQRALLFLMATIFLWSIGPLFVKYFTRFYNPWTQNAFRYSCAALALVLKPARFFARGAEKT